MNTSLFRAHRGVSLIFTAVAAAVMLSLPGFAGAVGTEADAMCNPVILQCGCGQVPSSHGCVAGANMWQCPCHESTNGFSTTGICVGPNKCLAQSTSGQNGGMGDIGQALQAISQLLQQMMQGGGGGGSGSSGGSSGGGTGTGPGGCAQYYNVTVPSSDPCAVYVPPVSDSLGSTTGSSAANDLISSLLSGGYTSTPLPSQSTTGTSNQPSNTNASQGTGTSQGTTTTPASNVTNSVLQIVPGVSGDIQYSSDNVTVLVNNVDTKAGTQVAGFYGTAAGGQPTTVISGMCQSRPWATNFLSFIIPGTFFDSLCELRGYKVGTPAAPAPAVVKSTPTVVKSTPAPAATTTAAAPTGPYVEPQADIWAVPASVPLGARTTVFWNAKGVTSCTETSPDGSFSQNTLSGGAATVPLSGATTYTISCLTPAGDHITNYVTVNLSAN